MKLAKGSRSSLQAPRSTPALTRDEIRVFEKKSSLDGPGRARYLTVPDVGEVPPGGGGGGGGSGGGGSGGGGATPVPTAGSVRKRKNQAALTDEGWDRLVQAMRCLQDDKGSRNWDYFTETHATYSFHDNDHTLPHHDGDDLSIHSPVYWLPWHRKFILEFEERLRDFDDSIELPYWNWTFYREIPEPLKKKIGGWMTVSRAVFHDGDKLPTVTELNQVKAATTFDSFDAQLINLHDRVHVWVGGAMGNAARSPKDPLFFLHHCFLDKVWADWQETHHPSLFPSEYRDMVMPPWGNEVEDVLSISNLDYEVGPG